MLSLWPRTMAGDLDGIACCITLDFRRRPPIILPLHIIRALRRPPPEISVLREGDCVDCSSNGILNRWRKAARGIEKFHFSVPAIAR